MATIKPLEDRIAVRPFEGETVSTAGLVLTNPIEEKVERGEVVAVGAGRVSGNGARIQHGINVGDIVLHNKYGGAEVEVGGEKLFILHAAEIIAVVG